MSTQDVARGLVEKCKQGDFLGAVNRFYSDNIVSVEPVGNENMPAEMRGIEAIRRKNETWIENNEVHGLQVKGPYVGDNEFAVQYSFDVTNKPTGRRYQLSEVAVYQVEGDKIVREQFFYNAPE